MERQFASILCKIPSNIGKESKIARKQPKIACKESKIVRQQPKIVCKESKIIRKEPKIACKESKIIRKEPKIVRQESRMVRQRLYGTHQSNKSFTEQTQVQTPLQIFQTQFSNSKIITGIATLLRHRVVSKRWKK